MARHRFRIGDKVIIVKQDAHGFPGPIGSTVIIAHTDDDGWYRDAKYGRIAPWEIEAPEGVHRPTHVTVTMERWDQLQEELHALRSAQAARSRTAHSPARNYGSNWADVLEG